jgi:shikimate kinase
MMGSGKSTVGALVASWLDVPFVDLDRVVEEMAGRRLGELFRDDEREFRRMEATALAQVARQSPSVVSAGGGALLDPTSLALARAAGTVVYLRAPAAALAGRLAGGTERPLLLDDTDQPLSTDMLLQRIEAILREREAAYLQADLVVDVSDTSPQQAAQAVIDGLGLSA